MRCGAGQSRSIRRKSNVSRPQAKIDQFSFFFGTYRDVHQLRNNIPFLLQSDDECFVFRYDCSTSFQEFHMYHS